MPSIDVMYFKSLLGALRIAEMGLAILVMICYAAAPGFVDGDGFIMFTAVVALICSSVFLVIYMLHVPDTIQTPPWILIEVGVTALWAFFYFISGCIAASITTKHYDNGSFGVASFFCFVAMVAYGANCFLFFRQYRQGPANQPPPPTLDTPGGIPPPGQPGPGGPGAPSQGYPAAY